MDAKTRLCCLIGNPVGHSLSPMIHNTLADTGTQRTPWSGTFAD